MSGSDAEITGESGGSGAAEKRFRVALTFPGERRGFVEQVAERLGEALGRERVLYDKWYEAEFARADLGTYLPGLYHEQSELIVAFLGQAYVDKEWCGLEWAAVLDLIKRRQHDAVMLCRFDKAEIPGLYSTAGFVDIDLSAELEADRVAELIQKRHVDRARANLRSSALDRGETDSNEPLDDILGPVNRAELIALFDRARVEEWHELVIFPEEDVDQWTDYARRAVLKGDWPAQHLISFHGRLDADDACQIATLQNLRSLQLNANRIGDDGVREIATLHNLVSLNLNGNGVGDKGARRLSKLQNLETLELANNAIGPAGAREIAKLQNLKTLRLYGNMIGADGARALLDAWVSDARSAEARTLDLSNNGDLRGVLPDEARNTTDAQAILAAYRRFRDARQSGSLVPMNEAKLLVVGNEAVGKTSLIRFLEHGQPRDPAERKTPGTAIHEKIDTHQWPLDEQEKNLAVNVWDFGGQEIMHGTHQFFLTERSLYLLVLEARREDDRTIHDWLDTIRNRGGDSPVIVVINKCDEGVTDNLGLDEKRLKAEYGNIVDFVRTSCDPGESAAASIDVLRRVICETLSGDPRLDEIRSPYPAPYLRIRRDIGELARRESVLSQREFERLCEEPWRKLPACDPETSGAGKPKASGDDGKLEAYPTDAELEPITDPAEHRALLRLLHDLGVVVAHGLTRDASAAQREITLLDPNWLTTAIYTVLNSRLILENSGEFTRSDLELLLDPELYPRERHEFIINMMRHPEIALCFPLPNHSTSPHDERFLIPAALSKIEPAYEDIWPEHESLRLRYEYEFLPPTMLARFIVESHAHLTQTRWRTGVVLRIDECMLLVKIASNRRRIDILVTGPKSRRRDALMLVHRNFEVVHDLNPEAKPKPRVPLPDDPDLTVSFTHLQKLLDKHGPEYEYEPEDANRAYAVGELLGRF